MRAHAVAAPFSSEEGASPPPPASCISVAISHTDAMCSATERRCACSASHVDVDQLSLHARTAAWSACSALCPSSAGRAAPPARSSRPSEGLEEQHQHVHVRARQHVFVVRLLVRDIAGAGAGQEVAAAPGGNGALVLL
eukprot:scaffold55253_cov61-Phaeocystis_antarctica.AAC.3